MITINKILFSEDLDFLSKRQMGNFPQIDLHLVLINIVKLFTKEKQRVDRWK